MTASRDPERQMRAYVAAWDDHDVDAIGAFCSPECEQFSPAELREVAEAWFKGYPDLTHEIEEPATVGDRVLARLTLRGTHRGTVRGRPPTGNVIEVADHVSTRFEDGLLVELHATADFASLFEQLGSAPDQTRRANEAVVRRYFDAVNDRDWEACVATLADEFSYGDIEGPEAMADRERRRVEAMDLTWDVEAMHATESVVTTRLRATGTHRGEILGLELTGESVEVSALTLSRVEDGQITEWWGEWDVAGLLDLVDAIDSPMYGESASR